MNIEYKFSLKKWEIMGGRLRYFKIFLLECNYINMRQVKWNEIYSIWEKNINELSSEVL